MSDMYLTLRRRLESMAEWTHLGTEVMKSARDAKGLSYEAMGRLLSISSKTYERREKSGRWPTFELDQLADVLGLEIDRPRRERVRVVVPDDATLLEQLEVMVARFEEVADRLEQLPPAREHG